MAAAVWEMLDALTPEIVGAAVSNTMASLNEPDQFPAASANCTYTVFMPLPELRVQRLEAENASAMEKPVPVFEKRICITAPWPSVAFSASVTEVEFVATAPLLITTDPVG